MRLKDRIPVTLPETRIRLLTAICYLLDKHQTPYYLSAITKDLNRVGLKTMTGKIWTPRNLHQFMQIHDDFEADPADLKKIREELFS
jgi:hypothetical protein